MNSSSSLQYSYTITLIILLCIVSPLILYALRTKSIRREVLLAVLIPWPLCLFSATSGNAGFVFFADFLGLASLFFAVKSHRQLVPIYRFIPSWLPATILIALPLVTTLRGLGVGHSFSFNDVAVSLTRGTLYCAVFFTAAGLAATGFGYPIFFRVLIVFTSLFMLAGWICITSGVKPDVWNQWANSGAARWTELYGAGFFGMYRGEIGALGALVACLIPAQTWRLGPKLLLLACLLLGMSATGTRQGLLFGLIGFVLCLALEISFRRVRLTITGSVVALVAILFVSPVIAVVTDAMPPQFQKYVLQRFVSSADDPLESASEARAMNRNVLQSILQEPVVMTSGVGFQEPLPMPKDVPTQFAFSPFYYADSDFLYYWQKAGLLGLLLLGIFYWRALKASWSLAKRSSVGAGFVAVVVTSILLSIGHFSITHVLASHAVAGYLQWVVLGAIFGLSASSRLNADKSLDLGIPQKGGPVGA